MSSQRHPKTRRARRLALAAGVACLALPAAAAQADSIVYIDGGNVWSASPDGARKVQLTDGGDWHSPTQADDGTIAAVRGTSPDIQVLAPDGRPLHTITTTFAKSGDGGTFAPRPVNLSFSPDGTKIAYAYVANSCPVASSCGTIQRSTFYTDAGATTATPIDTYGNQFGVSDPEWVTNSRTLVFGGSGNQVSIDDLGAGDYSQVPWMTPSFDLGDGEVSRDGTRLVTTAFYGDDLRLAFWAVDGDVKTQTPPAFPKVVCESGTDAKYSDPTWSPDSTSVAWVSSKGIELQAFSKYVGGDGCADAPGSYRVLSPTGSEPDWGPANPPAARYAATPVTTPGVTGKPGGTPGPAAGKPAVTLKGKRRATVRALKRGLTIKVKAPAAGKLSVRLLTGKRVLAKGSAKAKTAGTVKLRLGRVKRARALRGKTLKLVVKQAGTAGLSTTIEVG